MRTETDEHDSSISLDGQTILYLSAQPVAHNGRLARTQNALSNAGASHETLVLGNPEKSIGLAIGANYISRPTLPAPLSYRIQKHRAVEKIRKIRPNFIHAMDYISLDVGASSAKGRNVKIIYDACELFTETPFADSATKAYIEKVYKRTAPFVSGILAPNEPIGDIYKNKYPFWPIPVVVLNSCALPDPQTPYSGYLHKTSGLPLSTPILLFHGGLSKNRGLEQLIDDAASLPSPYILGIMGFGKLENKLREAAGIVNKKAERQCIVFIPPVATDQVLEVIRGAAVGLIPYEDTCLNHSYSSPNKLYEYCKANVPVWATNLPLLSETITKWGIGFVGNSPPYLSDLCNSHASMSKNGRTMLKTALADFTNAHSWQTDMTRLISLYSNLK